MLHPRSKPLRVLLVSLAMLCMSGCVNYLQPFKLKPAHPGLESTAHRALLALPLPEEKVVIAVYRFRDQTGQYKASDRAASWSTAVTQGATSILMRALEESGWFVPIEREGLSNLLNERQIIQSIRSLHTGPGGEQLGPLPPLLYAGVLLEGGIVGYDTNLITGGTGLRYFGIGPAGKFRQDQVTIYLRAVSTQNGRVLKTVHTTKTIISQQLDGGLFQFVDARRLAEGEMGYSFNEPPVLAVTEAIDEAVKNLIIEGIRDELWAPQEPYDEESAIFAAYDASLDETMRTDYFGRLQQSYRSGFGVGVHLEAARYEGDYVNPLVRPAGEFFLRGNVTPYLGLGAAASSGQIAAADAFEVSYLAADAHLLYYVLPRSRVSPFLMGGLGVLAQNESLLEDTSYFPYVTGGVGLEYMLTRWWGLNVSLVNKYPLQEGLDGLEMGSIHDNVWSLRTGFTLYVL